MTPPRVDPEALRLFVGFAFGVLAIVVTFAGVDAYVASLRRRRALEAVLRKLDDYIGGN